MLSHQEYLNKAIDLATKNVLNGGGPFGAIVVTADGREFEGLNRVTANNDPTAHAEVIAIRTACAESGTFDLSGASLYSSCEPCPMCLSAIYWARIPQIFFANTRQDAAEIGFDDDFIYRQIPLPLEKRAIKINQLLREEGLATFKGWAKKTDKVRY